MSVKSMLRRLARAAGYREKARPSPRFLAALSALGPDDVAIDCGANIGLYTELLAHHAGRVLAYEPDPVAFDNLRKRVARAGNVSLFKSAISNETGSARLFLHKDRSADPVRLSQGSSLCVDKGNVDQDSFVEVDTIDVAEVFADFDRVALLKMDVEGAEIDIINRMIDLGLHKRVGHAFVEVHDAKYPNLAEPTDRLRERLRAEGADYFDLDWH